ncbi:MULTISPECIES: LysR family transcriptional regulator [unclassified Rhizobacter]|uniref:LysR family transcriptional regulator n=1 Tax=unclassified Rhizobacter TaxID=2640088 RepID=UPI00070032D5|nr:MULTISPECIES: LysR family transcriptional regulator [unclassified Rhizobacter]KQU80284.1 LysR family transcriptional regulator [Rhizobacter sp. Root29]KQW13780.1 LysR family transcriptional regulator [Rhizobacter sp. Root1238]KRB20312.1 LysR family transcriptional regulator [Rhizobacter sp. Root16D2]
MDLNALADFNLVATHGGFGRASRASRRSKATLSRRIADLEEQLGVRLIERSAQGLELTEAGQLLLSRTEGPMNEVADAVTSTKEGSGQVRGQLRIAAPLLFSQLAMGRLCADFRSVYPDVTLEVVSDDRMVSLVDERFDVAIRVNPPPDTALVGRCFAKDRLVVVAAPSIPMPAVGEQPVRVPAVMSSRASESWIIDGGSLKLEPIPVLRLSSMLTLRDAAIAGAGAALLPQSIVWNQLTRGELVQWGAVGGDDVALWVLHASRRLASPKVKAFVDFICARYPDGSLVLPG